MNKLICLVAVALSVLSCHLVYGKKNCFTVRVTAEYLQQSYTSMSKDTKHTELSKNFRTNYDKLATSFSASGSYKLFSAAVALSKEKVESSASQDENFVHNEASEKIDLNPNELQIIRQVTETGSIGDSHAEIVTTTFVNTVSSKEKRWSRKKLREEAKAYLKDTFGNGKGKFEGRSYIEKKCIQRLDTNEKTDLKELNEYDGVMELYECPEDYSITHIESEHSNKREDRKWSVRCSQLAYGYDKCDRLTDYVNEMDKEMDFSCNNGSVISGVYSDHTNKQEDRRWKYKCCKAENTCHSDCQESGYINDWDTHMTFDVSGDERIVGFKSHHKNLKEDRKWKVITCNIVTC